VKNREKGETTKRGKWRKDRKNRNRKRNGKNDSGVTKGVRKKVETLQKAFYVRGKRTERKKKQQKTGKVRKTVVG